MWDTAICLPNCQKPFESYLTSLNFVAKLLFIKPKEQPHAGNGMSRDISAVERANVKLRC